MKGKKSIVLVLVLVLVLVTVPTVSAKSERIEFTYTEFCDFGTVDVGREIFNGQANYIVKHWTMTCYEYDTIPQMTGALFMDLNMNVVGGHEYPFWVSKGRLVTDEGGVWNLNCLYPLPSDDAQCVGQGEGKYAGMQVFVKFYPGYGGSGYIVDHSN
jgi:hypothetical protein